jgi:hypothetical protein
MIFDFDLHLKVKLRPITKSIAIPLIKKFSTPEPPVQEENKKQFYNL